MRHFKKLILIVCLLFIQGCQNKATYKYAIYNLDENYIKVLNDGYFSDSLIGNPYVLPLTEEQISGLKENDIETIPFYEINTVKELGIDTPMVEGMGIEVFVNQEDVSGYEESQIGRLFPYFKESDFGKIEKKYVGEIDDNKKYIYLTKSLAQSIHVKGSIIDLDNEIFPDNLYNHLEDEFTDEYCIKATLTIPVKSISGDTYYNINYMGDKMNFGPYPGYGYEETTIEEEFYVKGVISYDTKYYYSGGSQAYIDSNLLQQYYPDTAEVPPATRLVESKSKSVEKNFDELGIQYYLLKNS